MLLGRGGELERIQLLLDGARSGSSGVLALVGEAGIGKSSLLDWAAEHAEGMHVLRVRSVESEARLPFGGLFELLRPALDALDGLPTPQAEALASALALRPARAHDRFAVGAATLGLLAAYAESDPLLVLVDDANWLDGSSADAPEAVVAAPLRITQTYLELAQRLPDATRRLLVLTAASDVGDVVVIEHAAERLGLALPDIAAAEAVGLVDARGGRVEFRHPLMRSAVYGSATPEERRSAHRALADSLPDREADRRAWHLALAAIGSDEAASSALEQAGARARERSAYDVASHAFERAASLSPDDGRRAFLTFSGADTAWLAGLAERALALLDDAAAYDPRPALESEIEHLRGQITLRRGPVAEARAILRAAAERAQSPELFAEAGEAAFFAGDAEDARACGERAAELAAADGSERDLFFGRMSAGMGLLLVGEASGADLVRDALGILERSEELELDPRLLSWAAAGPLWLREAGTGESVAERALAAARSQSAVGVLPHLLAHVAVGAAAGNDYVAALATFDETIHLARETGQSVMLCVALARLSLVDARCGRHEVARERAEEALALARELGAHLFEIWALQSLGELELVRGDAGRASGIYEELEAVLARRGISDADLSPAPERVELYLRTGRAGEAPPVAAAFHAVAAAKGQPWALARAGRALALVASDDAFADEFERALELHAETPDVFETARTRLAYGSRLRRSGRRVRAREQLRAAHTAFEELGAESWAEIARTELAATGETARRRHPATLADLTPQELKVALLLAEGKTRREAASALFLSPKTIEYHLRNAYRKLGIRSRDELAEAFRAEPTASDRESSGGGGNRAGGGRSAPIGAGSA